MTADYGTFTSSDSEEPIEEFGNSYNTLYTFECLLCILSREEDLCCEKEGIQCNCDCDYDKLYLGPKLIDLLKDPEIRLKCSGDTENILLATYSSVYVRLSHVCDKEVKYRDRPWFDIGTKIYCFSVENSKLQITTKTMNQVINEKNENQSFQTSSNENICPYSSYFDTDDE